MTIPNNSKIPSPTYGYIWKLSYPQILMMFCNFIIGFTDVWVAGKIGKEVQGCMGFMAQILFIFLLVSQAIANGSVAAITQSLGSGLYKRASRFAMLCLQLSTITGFFFFFLSIFLRHPLLELLHIPNSIFHIADALLKITLYTVPFYCVFIISNALFRAKKLVKIPLYSLILVTAINIFGDLGLGLGYFNMPNLGYKGIAWSTFGAIICGMIFNIIALRKTNIIATKFKLPWRWVKIASKYILKVAWPSATTQIVWNVGYLILYSLVASLPYESIDSLAGMAAGMRIESLLFLPGMAFNLTAAILVGHHIGAGDFKGAKLTGYKVLFSGVIFVSFFAILVIIFSNPIMSLLTNDPIVLKKGVDYLFFNAIATPFTLATMIIGGALAGAGATLYQTIIMGCSTFFVRLPLAYLLGHIILKDSRGIWIAMLTSMTIQACVGLYVYHYKNWKKFALKSRHL